VFLEMGQGVPRYFLKALFSLGLGSPIENPLVLEMQKFAILL